ncbi:CAP domain-containing protein [Aulosira sp. FACHB-615]|uniref:CAP domain-containing protein n=1 Tax=Aulosira sp. FACHB-615 TaxID=2692777 RepID=UPI001689DA76|nr:CAP domain-containing protein [Aulosira sp. FACHB-615]MBD2489668.1 CAP domain-containing protein [Aulosira sp. FACHB-615]
MIQNKISSAGVATLALIGGVTAFSAPVQTATLQHTQMSDNNIQLAQTVNTAKLEAEVFTQINQYRASLGLPALRRNSTIDNQARTHSQNMATSNTLSHNGFGARIQAIAVTIPYSAAAENVAYNQGYSNPATQAVQGWLRSPGHLANIKGNYNLTGVGVAVNSRGAVYFTQIFIRRR